jgi:hypothetical protein
MEMVLCDPSGIEAAVFGMHNLGNGQAVALGRVYLIEQAGEKAQTYSWHRHHDPIKFAP